MIRRPLRPVRHGVAPGHMVLAILVGLGGCSMSREPFARPASRSGFAEVDRTAAARDAAPVATPAPAQSPTVFRLASFRADEGEPTPTSTPAERRIIIYNASFKIIVSEVEESIRRTEALAVELGGWVQEIRGEQITIRIPVARYEEATQRVESLGRVAHRELEAADVTEEYVDLEARLKNALAVRQRLQGLLEKAEDVKAALAVEKEMGRVTEEIERLQGKLELLRNRVAYSTITATFERVYRTAPTPQLMKLPFHWLRELDPNRLTSEY